MLQEYRDLSCAIKALAKEKNAVILAHYYQEDEIQEVADFVGDSLDLSKKAAAVDADIVVFCGVFFMAEVAKILNPTRKVILPDIKAGCSLSDSCRGEDFKKFRQAHSDHISVTYINSSAEVKCYSDIICTSSNAESIINSIPLEKKILFAPDRYLGEFLSEKTGRDMLLWQGSCVVHESFSEASLVDLKVRHRDAHVIAHPECPGNLLRHADCVGSTKKLLQYAIDRPGSKFIVLTEEGLLYQMKKYSPGSTFYMVETTSPGCDACSKCPYMRLNTLEKLYKCISEELPEIILDEEIIMDARRSVDAMMALSFSNASATAVV
ncbi:quinolinate synthase NadA [Candidatus Anaplasma sp. TIGMIC]|uniref:quinolinate synthase NadA n=1 Tax=Candidatus Anaplasma sp. TIGMIC TaxID=3020713 RepID=UPI00232AF074|nr:quinolinate synthase NadA [Candidatus Anaplasma sp. TIGMIC]MDB1135487.1 quinolinate synthase NadA [Candidatus Anaplasma sp. TIGMIC]